MTFSLKMFRVYLFMGDIVRPNNIRFDCIMFHYKS